MYPKHKKKTTNKNKIHGRIIILFSVGYFYFLLVFFAAPLTLTHTHTHKQLLPFLLTPSAQLLLQRISPFCEKSPSTGMRQESESKSFFRLVYKQTHISTEQNRTQQKGMLFLAFGGCYWCCLYYFPCVCFCCSQLVVFFSIFFFYRQKDFLAFILNSHPLFPFCVFLKCCWCCCCCCFCFTKKESFVLVVH